MNDTLGAVRLEAAAAQVSLLQVVRRSWRLLAAVALMVGVLVGQVSSQREPVYAASGKIWLSTSESPFTNGSSNARDLERRTQDEIQRLQSTAVLERAAQAMGGEWTAGTVRQALTVRGDPTVSYVRISAQAGSRADAGLLLTRVVDAYEELVTEESSRDAARTISQIDTYAAELSATADGLRAQLDARRAEFEAQMPQLEPTDYTRELERRLSLDQTYQDLERRLTSTSAELDQLESRAVEVRLAAALSGTGVDSFEVLRAPTSPVSPAPLRDGLLGGALAFALAAAVLWARAGREPPVLDPERVAMVLGAPVLGTVPRPRRGPARMARDRSSAVYDDVLQALEFEVMVEHATSVVMTGLGSSVGVTSTVLHVGMMAARAGHDVLLVDADLRHRGLTRSLALEQHPGLSDLGAGTHVLADCVHLCQIEGGVVAVVPAGTRPGLMSFPDSEVLADVLSHADHQLILVDAPPIVTAAEATLTAQLVDRLVVAVPAASEIAAVERLLARLAVVARPVLGIVGQAPRRERTWRWLLERRSPAPPPSPASVPRPATLTARQSGTRDRAARSVANVLGGGRLWKRSEDGA